MVVRIMGTWRAVGHSGCVVYYPRFEQILVDRSYDTETVSPKVTSSVKKNNSAAL